MAPTFSPLYLIKTLNCGSGRVEVHGAPADNNYTAFKVEAVTPIQLNDAPNGNWAVEGDDVYFIKTANTGSDTIEIHRLSSKSKYSTFDIEAPSGFGAGEASNGIFTIDNGDLYSIKTKNTATPFIEVYMAGHQNRFANIDRYAKTIFRCDETPDGHLTVRGGNLYLIKARDTGSGQVEVYLTEPGKKYEIRYITWFSTGDDKYGTWKIGTKGDLYFVKKNPAIGHMEVHVATAESKYQEVAHYTSVFNAADDSNGFWCV